MEIILLPLHISCTAASNQRRSRFSVTRRSLLPPLPLRIAPMKSGRWRARSPLRMSVDLEPDQASSSSSSDLDLLDTEAQVAALRGMLFISQHPFFASLFPVIYVSVDNVPVSKYVQHIHLYVCICVYMFV